MKGQARTALGLFLLLCALSAWALVAVPELSRRVTDLTATLSAEQVAALESRLATFEAQKGSQIAVLVLPTTQPEDIAQFGIRVAEQWKIGRTKVDDGVILVVAKDDRDMRLEVGYGLEGVIPDAIAKRVIAETITPHFKAGDYYGGIEAGVAQVMRLIEGEALPPPASGAREGDDAVFGFLVMGGVIGGWLLSTLMSRPAAGGLAALGLGGVLWWMMSGGRRRKTGATTVLDDSVLPGNDGKPISVIGASSGGSVNTGDTSFLTDFSQAGLGTIDTHDVDPIAEAEVYMAYGRDAQAEEILKEAINKNPDRHEVRVKLLEIYAARRNTQAFAAVAGDLYAALGSDTHPLWEKACEMGREIDPTNPLYGGGTSGASPAATVAATAAVAGGAVAFGSGTEAAAPSAPEPVAEPETQFDPAPMAFEPSPAPEAPVVEMPAFEPAPEPEQPAKQALDLDFELPDLDLPAAADEPLKLDLGLEADNGPDSKFDFSGLDLDLGESGGSELELDEVGTKLDLARAYVEMGDKEGAREILNEVIAEGNDKQKSDAQGMLSSLG